MRHQSPTVTERPSHNHLLRITLPLMIATDVGFIVYWILVATDVLPADQMFAEYTDPRVVAWNWSFLPLDIAASLTGLAAARAVRARAATATPRLVLSLALTSMAGAMALVYWALRGQFDLSWWLPNIFLFAFPLPLLSRLAWTGGLVVKPPVQTPDTRIAG
jgi:hypothetical protein